jgi:predicted O-methyltransferase YrrM
MATPGSETDGQLIMLRFVRNIPHYIRRVPVKLKLANECLFGAYFKAVPPGHFYSPLPDLQEIARRSDKIYGPTPDSIPGVDLRTEFQKKLLQKFESYYTNLPFDRDSNPESRYFRSTRSFPFQDAFTLYGMIREYRPQRIIEVGSGSSSCVMLDCCDSLGLGTKLTFIEPFPDFLLSLIRKTDTSRFELRKQIVQDVPLEIFGGLDAGDILFIDSSHVSKTGSDVNFLFFEVLPILKPGVVIHFHDIFFPFEYAMKRLLEGVFWNEAYLLHAFLMFNQSFEILMFNDYVNHLLPQLVAKNFPLCSAGLGASIWLRRI